jgi:4-hydroxy-2-oxoheptanedioate aldolase
MYPRHAANARFDGIWVEQEHNTWDMRELQRIIALHHLADIDCVVRPAFLGKTQLYGLLDMGATGVMIPFVTNQESARYVVDALKFPPIGQRGFDGAGLDNDFFLQGTKVYPENANRQSVVVVQIETPEALENVGEIAAVKGIDVLFIGPGDLALRLGCPRNWEEPKMQDAQKRVADAAAENGIFWGRPSGTSEDMAWMIEEGARFLATGSDFESIAYSMQNRYRVNIEKAIAACGMNEIATETAVVGQAY